MLTEVPDGRLHLRVEVLLSRKAQEFEGMPERPKGEAGAAPATVNGEFLSGETTGAARSWEGGQSDDP